MGSMVEKIARVLEPQAWAALGTGDTLAYKNRRTSSLRKARAALQALMEPTPGMIEAGQQCEGFGGDGGQIYAAMIRSAMEGE